LSVATNLGTPRMASLQHFSAWSILCGLVLMSILSYRAKKANATISKEPPD
jgi:hypothetical protein